MDPLVSVVMPTYNSGAYLDEALRSVRGQTLHDLEVIVVDDGSDDDSSAIAGRHAAEDDRIRILRRAHEGLSAARNAGVDAARAPWIALLDADDIAMPRRLERQLAYLEAMPHVAALGTYAIRMGASGDDVGVMDIGPLSASQLDRLRRRNEVIFLVASSVVFSRRIALKLGGFRRTVGAAEDVDLWTRMADDHLVLALPERLVRYRIHGGSASSQRFAQQMEDTMRISENAKRRRSGRPELDPATFHAMLRTQPRLVRLRRSAEWRSRYWYRVGAALLANRQPAGIVWLAASFAAMPSIPVRRIRRQVVPWIRFRTRQRLSRMAKSTAH